MAPTLPVSTQHRTTYKAISPARPELSTRGRNAVITGGGSGVGAAIAQSLAKSGISQIALLGRTEKTLLETKTQVEATNPDVEVWIYSADLSNAGATAAALKAFTHAVGAKIDILIANAGYMAEVTSIISSDAADWWLAYETTVLGNFNLIRAFDGLAAPGASVIHVSTSAIHIDYLAGYSSYQSSKAAATKMFEHYHYERPDLFVLQIHPGLQRTPMAKKFEASVEEYKLPWDDISIAGDFAVWAVSDEAKFLNGRFVWATWDVEELKGIKKQIEEDPRKLTIGLLC